MSFFFGQNMDEFLLPPARPGNDVPPNPAMPEAPATLEHFRPKRRLPPPLERPAVMPKAKKKARLPPPLMKATPKYAPALASAKVAGRIERLLDLLLSGGQAVVVIQEFTSVAFFFQRCDRYICLGYSCHLRNCSLIRRIAVEAESRKSSVFIGVFSHGSHWSVS